MLSTLAAILALGVLIVIHEAGHFFVARWSRMKVPRFSIFFGPAIAKIKRGETEYQIGAIPLGGFVQIEGMNPHDGSDPSSPTSYMNRPVHLRIATLFAGPAANYLLGFLMLFAFYAFFATEPLAPVRVLAVSEGSAAEKAGLAKGDLIVGTATAAFDRADELRETIQEHGKEGLVLIVERDGQQRPVKLVPDELPGGDYRIGIELEETRRRRVELGIGGGAKAAATHVAAATVGMLKFFGGLFQGQGCDQVSGPIGMVKGVSRRVERSVTDALASIGEISVMLGIFNLLPIPALDGSRLLFLLVGVLRRKPVDAKIEAYVHVAGLLLLFALMILISIGDVTR
jgi:regulator of sigma E protease